LGCCNIQLRGGLSASRRISAEKSCLAGSRAGGMVCEKGFFDSFVGQLILILDCETMEANDDHFEIDEVENLIDNLEMIAHFIEAPIPYNWKWAVIALHQALYGALISTLQGSDPRQTVVDRQKDSGKAVMLHVNPAHPELVDFAQQHGYEVAYVSIGGKST
jgi:hypothetical protein